MFYLIFSIQIIQIQHHHHIKKLLKTRIVEKPLKERERGKERALSLLTVCTVPLIYENEPQQKLYSLVFF